MRKRYLLSRCPTYKFMPKLMLDIILVLMQLYMSFFPLQFYNMLSFYQLFVVCVSQTDSTPST